MYHKYIWKTYIYNTATPIWHPSHSHCETKVKECTRLAVPSGRIDRIGSESLFSRTNCRNWSNQMGGADRIKMSEKRQAIYRIYSCSWCNVNMTFPSLDKYVHKEINNIHIRNKFNFFNAEKAFIRLFVDTC